ncbi:MAG: extracellular solute-binding protein [Bacteroidetes bacterium]|nr:extracellular solute-binding protein [Bacteroidota bacterium]
MRNSSDPLYGTINASGAFALYPIMVKWSEEFKKLHPNVKFNVSAGGAGKGISDAVGGLVDIGMVSRELNPSEMEKGAFTIAVTKDAVVPVVCVSNPNLKEILQKGISAATFKNIFIGQQYNTWKELGFSTDLPLHVYTRSDAAGAAESWAKYFGKKQEDLQGIGVFGDPGLLQSVKKDIRSIGYNNIGFAYNIKTRQPNKGIVVVPIDLNGNGKIDGDENFYNNLDQISAAIKSGKFPSPPARDLYFVTKGKPQDKAVVEFIQWVLTEGQQFVTSSGYVAFDKEKLEMEIQKFKNGWVTNGGSCFLIQKISLRFVPLNWVQLPD